MSKTSLINLSRVNSIFTPVIVDGQIISPTNSVKILGFIFYVLSIKSQVYTQILSVKKILIVFILCKLKKEDRHICFT